MTLTFLGTRGEIDARTRKHRMHTSLLVRHRRTRIMIDCGKDWSGRLGTVKPNVILITHAHPDHAGGLKHGASCPVFATAESWQNIRTCADRVVTKVRRPFYVGGVQFEAFRLEHSIRAPAVGYRLNAGGASIFYSPDVASIHEAHEALAGIRLYIGDGAAITRPILRKRDHALIGHASIRMQLEWCRTERVPAAIFTHCGSEIVKGDQRRVEEKIAALGEAAGVDTSLSFDGFEIRIGD